MQSEDGHATKPTVALETLPSLADEDLALLLRNGDVIIANGSRLTRHSGRRVAEHCTEFETAITALAESESGVFVATDDTIHVIESGARLPGAAVRLDGTVRQMLSIDRRLYAVTSKSGRTDGKLFEFDVDRAVIVTERALLSAATQLSSDASGRFLGLSDGKTFQALQRSSPSPCRPKPPQPRPETPADSPCDCHRPKAAPPPCTDEHDGTRPKDKPDDRERDPCEPAVVGVPTPDGGRITGDGSGVTHYPPGSMTPRNPCRTQLFFEVAQLHSIGEYLVAADRSTRNVAVLARSDLRILSQVQYSRGARLLTNPALPYALVHTRNHRAWQRLELEYFEPDALERGPGIAELIQEDSITFTGSPLPVLRGERAPAIGIRRVLVIPAADPGQAFNDADLPKLAAHLHRFGFKRAQHFYFENSFGALDNIVFDVNGVNVGAGGVIRLPKPVAEYYHPLYVGAHIDMVKNGLAFPTTIVFDGRERMTIHATPQTGGRAPATFEVKFYAALATAYHERYPALIRFLGTETAAISVRLPSGAMATLNLAFTPFNLDIKNDAEMAAAIATLENYLVGVFAAGYAAGGFATPVFARPSLLRMDQGTGGPGFIVTGLSNAAVGGAKLEVHAINYVGAGDPLGFKSNLLGRIPVASGVTSQLTSYLDFVTTMAQEAAKYSYVDRRLADSPVVTVDAGAGRLITTLHIKDFDGGPGATMNLTNVIEMGALFDSFTAIPNSNVTAGRSMTPKDGNEGLDGLIDQVYSAVVDRWAPANQILARKDEIAAFFGDYDMVVIGMVHPAQTGVGEQFVLPQEMWNAGPSSWNGHRAVEAARTARYSKHPQEIQFFSNWNLVPFAVPLDYPLLCHELGHAIGLDDLYAREAGYRDDLIYMGSWATMDNHSGLSHHCGYHKWQSGWIPDARVHSVPRPEADQTVTHEALLVPVEHWHANDTLIQAARAAFATPDMAVVQLIELPLGGNADVFALIEARQSTSFFSKALPHDPAVLISNCIVWWDKTRYAFNGRYRAPAHLLHSPDTADNGKPYFARLQNAGDSFDLAKGRELPAKGIVVAIVDRKNVAGVEVFRIKVERKNSREFIDLFFSSSDPYYKNPDIWVDWSGDNGPGGNSSSDKKQDVRTFPLGQPDHQGEKIRVPDSGSELHWIAARLRNIGNVHAEKVKLAFSICEPPGAGDRGNFKVRETVVLEQVPPTGLDKPVFEAVPWQVPAGFKGHTCVMVEIADLRVPVDHTGTALASDDVWQANNRAQKNVSEIGPKANSPFAPVEFEFSVNNSARWPEVAYLEPEGLPYGMRLTVAPKRRKIAAGETAIFRCKLELDDRVIDASCRSDHNFRLNAWRVDEDSTVLWGGVEYRVRPRKGTTSHIAGYWDGAGMIEITGHVSPHNVTGRVRIRLAYANQQPRWVSAELKPGATFSYKEKAPANTFVLLAVALFEGNLYYSESQSPETKIIPPPVIH